MLAPSGDQDGSRSWTPGVRVRLRASPFFAGRVSTSPRYPNTARAPVGEMDALRMFSGPSTQRGLVSVRSAATPIRRRSWRSEAGS